MHASVCTYVYICVFLCIILYNICVYGGGKPGLYRGVVPTVQRAALLTATQLGTYDEIKHALLALGGEDSKICSGYLPAFKEGPLLHFVSGSVAGLGVSLVTSPVDTIRTR